MNSPQASAAAGPVNSVPGPADNTVSQAPIDTWEDAVPLGKGLLGGLFWGEATMLRLSLDRGDLQDERSYGDPDWWRSTPWSSSTAENPDPWGAHDEGTTPTKLPAGRLELTLEGTTVERQDLLVLAQQRCMDALRTDAAELELSNRDRWRDSWSPSSVSPPNPRQGVWSADNGRLPPGKGDYHNDLNYQLTYGAHQQSGDFASGESYLDFLWQLTPEFEQVARDFYGTGGPASTGVMSMSAWNAHLFYLHWRFTADPTLLAERAYPWACSMGTCMAELLTANNDGVLVFPRPSSPEVFDNFADAWPVPHSNYALMCLKMLFHALGEMAQALDLQEDAARWDGLAGKLGDSHSAPDGELLLEANTRLAENYRHLSNLIGIHPFNLISIEGGEEDQQRIKASLAAWDELGTNWWTGYSRPWMGCLHARIGDGKQPSATLKSLPVPSPPGTDSISMATQRGGGTRSSGTGPSHVSATPPRCRRSHASQGPSDMGQSGVKNTHQTSTSSLP